MPQLVFRYKKRRSVIKQRLRKKSLSGRKRPTVPVSENLEPEEPVPLALHAPGGTQPAGSHRGACSGHRQPRFQREWLVRRRRRVRPVAGRQSPTTPGNSPEHPAKKELPFRQLFFNYFSSNEWITTPERSFGSNHVVFGGMMLPVSAILMSCCIETG